MGDLNEIQRIAIWTLPVLLAITVHEAAHGLVAKIFGDRTAEMLGRVTLNPLKHIDPIGTVLLPLFMLWVGGFVFGWAKPVPITAENLHRPKQDMAWVAIAGPLSNLLMGIGWAVVMKIGYSLGAGSEWLARPLVYMGGAGITINVILMVLNLLPLPPLDGGRVVAALLPGPVSYQFSRIEPYGMVILIALLATGVLSKILGPAVDVMQTLLFNLFSL